MRILLILLSFLLPLNAFAAEEILHFHSDITVTKDAMVEVTESIIVTSEARDIKRGIYRDIPVIYRDSAGKPYRVDFNILRILRDGKTENYHTEDSHYHRRIYIGSSDVYLKPGQYRYDITYRMSHQISFFDAFDELAWNVTGNDWQFPIQKASATITLPGKTAPLQYDAYTGVYGATEKAFTAFKDDDTAALHFVTTRRLAAGEGLTIAVGWPKNIVTPPAAPEYIENFTIPRLYINGLIVLILLYYFFAWSKVGRDPAKGNPRPTYSPPEGFSPAACHYISSLGMGSSHTAFAASLVNMAIKGVIRIHEEAKTFTIAKISDQLHMLSPGEKVIANKLFALGNNIELKQPNHQIIGRTLSAFKKKLATEYETIYFKANRLYLIPGILLSIVAILAIPFGGVSLDSDMIQPGEEFVVFFLMFWLTGWTFGTGALLFTAFNSWKNSSSASGYMGALFLTLFSLPFVGGEIAVTIILSKMMSGTSILQFFAAIGINALFYYLLRAPTMKGRQVMDKIDSFKTFLSATASRKKTLNIPQPTEENFERYLPYAIALGVSQEWHARLATTLARTSSKPRFKWYDSRKTIPIDGLVSHLANNLSSAIRSSSTSPSSSGSGSSGGGGGGGGGGGW